MLLLPVHGHVIVVDRCGGGFHGVRMRGGIRGSGSGSRRSSNGSSSSRSCSSSWGRRVTRGRYGSVPLRRGMVVCLYGCCCGGGGGSGSRTTTSEAIVAGQLAKQRIHERAGFYTEGGGYRVEGVEEVGRETERDIQREREREREREIRQHHHPHPQPTIPQPPGGTHRP